MQNDVIKHFDTSNKFWEKFGMRDETLEKNLGYFEIESIDNPCQIVIAINYGTIIRTGITCKKITCYMRDPACRWFIVENAKIFRSYVKHF